MAVITVPAGYQAEAIPPALKLETKFGKYAATAELKGDKIYYYRNIEKYDGQFPASDYNDLAKFYEQIYKADRSRIVLVKKE